MSIIYVDIDMTICTYKKGVPLDGKWSYEKAIPSYENIAKINKLYDEGHTIVYYTARGSRSGTDWTELTMRQLNEWQVKYHELRLDKPYYDLLIDDRAQRIEEI